MNPWEQAADLKRAQIRKLSVLISNYSYSDSGHAYATNAKLNEFMLVELRKAKASLFEITDIAYQLQKDEPSRLSRQVRDELDIFLDEVKVTTFHWETAKPADVLKRIIDHDLDLMNLAEKIVRDTDRLHKGITVVQRPGEQGFSAMQWQSLFEKIMETKKHIDEMVNIYKEREGLFNLDFEEYLSGKAYEEIKKDVGKVA